MLKNKSGGRHGLEIGRKQVSPSKPHKRLNSKNYQEPLGFSMIRFGFREDYFSSSVENRLEVG